MESSSFYDMNEVTFYDRETFSNAILLLSVVKSEAYYIIGFSRQKNIIEIGFDFKSSFHSVITERVMIDFNNPKYIQFKCRLKDLNDIRLKSILGDNFFVDENDIVFKRSLKKDKITPISIEKMDSVIRSVKYEIIDFIEKYYEAVI